MKVVLKPIAVATMLVATVAAAPKESRHDQVAKLVVQIQRADYGDDRASLKRLYDELEPFVADKKLGAKVRYWRGFALWRRVLNGMNDNVDAKELALDLGQAVSEFEEAMAQDPAFVDAKAAAGSTLGRLMFLYAGNPAIAGEFEKPERMRESVNRALSYLNEAAAAQPENPRVLWMIGPVHWYLSQRRGEQSDKSLDAAMDSYKKGLEAARAHKATVRDPLVPSWGEPECLMSLASGSLYRDTPNLVASEKYAREALALVPYWHYVRDILVPAIDTAKAKAARGKQ
jgi:tetratricopeptide (TPR) repeat protein